MDVQMELASQTLLDLFRSLKRLCVNNYLFCARLFTNHELYLVIANLYGFGVLIPITKSNHAFQRLPARPNKKEHLLNVLAFSVYVKRRHAEDT